MNGIIRLRLNALPESLIVIVARVIVSSPVHEWPCPVLPVIRMASNRTMSVIFGRVTERKEIVRARGRGVIVMMGSPVAVAIFGRFRLRGCAKDSKGQGCTQ